MSTRHWRAYGAVGGLILLSALVLGAVVLYASPGPEPVPREKSAQGPSYERYAAAIGCQPAQIKALPAEKQADKRQSCADAREQHDFNQANLAQSARSADAAEGQAHIAYWQARSGFIQTIATVGALIAAVAAAIAAGFAAFYARDAAQHTQRGADAAEKSLNMIERPWLFIAPKGDERPYLPFLGGGPLEITQPVVRFQWRNVGRSPAIMQSAKYRLLFAEELPAIPEYVESQKNGEQVVPDKSESVTDEWKCLVRPTEEDLVKIETGAYKLFFFGELTYVDVHGKEHVSGFGVEYLRRERFWTEAGGKAYNYRT